MTTTPWYYAWFYNSRSGMLEHSTNPVEFVDDDVNLPGSDWIRLAVPGSATQSQVEAYVAQKYPNGATPTTSTGQAAKNATGSTVGQAVKDATGSLTYGLSVTGIAGWFKRGLMLFFGGALIIIGVAKLTGTSGKVASVAELVGAGAIVRRM